MTVRALAILDAFSADQPVLTLTDVSRRSGLPLSTVHRLTAELLRWGALDRGADGGYRIGLRLWQVAVLAPRATGLRDAALPFLEDLSQVTRENAQLGVREGTELLFVERIAGRCAVPVLTRTGARFPLHASGLGLALLAHAPADEQEAVLARPLAGYTPWTLTRPDAVRAALADVRRLGHAVSDRQVTTDALSVAAPVRDARGEVRAAVSVVVRARGARVESLAALVTSAARGIGRALPVPPAQPPRSATGRAHGRPRPPRADEV
ncbi:IclR family transcriptional regulator [Geodermatophilus sabuli]|uniref:IclR family transcriptional regulator n=1 Tax=Geodermatophilus sabuli TaxID=1564158 RepID=A0A7K3VUZ6_9ACTN|nr:IclR family transcriptional regulator [Geodermatophilus sabuli]